MYQNNPEQYQKRFFIKNNLNSKLLLQNNANADIEDSPDKGFGAQLYSEPVYWQALRIKSGMDASNHFENYYILEVNWEKAAEAAGDDGLKDDKETDIIYIAAEATS